MERLLLALCMSMSLVTGAAAAEPARYAWLAEWSGALPPSRPLAERFAPPDGFRRVEVTAGSYAEWLRGLPVRTDREEVYSYKGEHVFQASSAGVVLMDVGRGDLQQCADAAIRLRAEYLWSRGKVDGLRYHYTNGDVTSWADWKAGKRVRYKGKERIVTQVSAKPKPDHGTFRAWLQHVFMYAGTSSLARDTRAVAEGEAIEAGDTFVWPGYPGHAVVVLDVAEHPDGRRVALVGQSFIPAQDFHVIAGPRPATVDGVWFVLPERADGVLKTPLWDPFRRDSARRFVK